MAPPDASVDECDFLFDDDEFDEERLFEALENDDVLFIEDVDNVTLLETLLDEETVLDEHVERDLPHLPEEEEDDDVDHGGARLVDELEEGEVIDLLKGSRPTVYFVAGWVLFRMRKRLTMKEYQHYILDFVASCLASTEELAKLHPLMEKLERREIHSGCLCRPGSAWFHFVQSLDALYCVNLTSANALKHGPDILSLVNKTISESEWLEEQFVATIPDSIQPKGKEYLLKVYRSSILPSYSRMRARDTLRRIKSHRTSMECAAEGLTTRAKVKSATIAAQAKGASR